MAKQDSIQDNNHFPALIAHTGTAGTAETVRLVADADGQLKTTASVSAPGTQIVEGADAAGAAASNDPVLIGGTDAGGTVYAMKVDTNGVVQTNASLALDTGTITTGSLANIGQVHNAGTMQTGSLANIAFIHEIGTMPSISIGESTGGTLDIVTRVGNLGTIESGSILVTSIPQVSVGTLPTLNLTTGTVTTGSLTNVATLHNGTVVVSALNDDLNGGTVDLVSALAVGTVGGKAASGAAASQNPVFIAGTDAGGTVYGLKVDTNGVLQTSASLALDSGTITTGSLANIATLHNGTVVVSSIAAGDNNIGNVDIDTIPQISVGTIPNVNVATGTQQTLGTVANLNNGTVRISVGTMTTGSLTNLATLHNGTVVVSALNDDLNGGTIDLVTQANVTVGTFSADIPGGTIDLVSQVNVNTVPTGSVVTSTHTLGTGGGTFFGTLVAPAGAGTSIYLVGLSIVGRSGTADCGIANNVAGTTGAGVYARGKFNPGGGIARTFNPPINLGANGTLAYFLIDAGTADFTVDYIVST